MNLRVKIYVTNKEDATTFVHSHTHTHTQRALEIEIEIERHTHTHTFIIPQPHQVVSSSRKENIEPWERKRKRKIGAFEIWRWHFLIIHHEMSEGWGRGAVWVNAFFIFYYHLCIQNTIAHTICRRKFLHVRLVRIRSDLFSLVWQSFILSISVW